MFRVTGGARLDGEVVVEGAKNSVLKLMAATLLAEASSLGGCLAAGFAPLAGVRKAWAQAGRPVRIGVLNDQSGPYADLAGPGSALAVRMAAADAGAFPVVPRGTLNHALHRASESASGSGSRFGVFILTL